MSNEEFNAKLQHEEDNLIELDTQNKVHNAIQDHIVYDTAPIDPNLLQIDEGCQIY
jgi:hypothetical protein